MNVRPLVNGSSKLGGVQGRPVDILASKRTVNANIAAAGVSIGIRTDHEENKSADDAHSQIGIPAKTQSSSCDGNPSDGVSGAIKPNRYSTDPLHRVAKEMTNGRSKLVSTDFTPVRR